MGRKEFFESRKAAFEKEVRQFEIKFRRVSYLRVVVALALLSAFIYFANDRNGTLMVVIVLLSPILFGSVVKWHNSIKYKRDKSRALLKINKEEIDRHDLQLKEFDEGTEFEDVEHPYASDLDLFGQHSLFQLLNRTNTGLGRGLLASWMKSPADKDVIRLRQEVVQELSQNPEWIQNFIGEGAIAGDHQKNVDSLLGWLEEEEERSFLQQLWIPIVLAAGLIVSLFFVIEGTMSWGFLIIPLAFNFGALSTIFRRLKDLTENTYEGAKALKGYKSLIEIVEGTSFKCEKLVEIQSGFHSNEVSSSEAMKKFDKLLDILNSRANSFYIVFDLLFMSDFFLLFGLKKWKMKYGQFVRSWFNSLAEIEALVSLSSYQFSNEDNSVPLISEEEYLMNAVDLGHPLIHSEVSVCNSVSVNGRGTVIVVTGSNMSGKSTFLRTVGINMVLAYLGTSVSAKKLELSLMNIFTSMRTADNLEESISSFYAELKRLQSLIQSVENYEKPTMYMIDEILKGTNSSDRHLGAKSLITQLSKTSSIGWVSTHDLALGEMEQGMDQITNMSFNSKLENDNLIFDYKISEGVCHTFNASVLMRKMGIVLLDE